MDWREEIPKSLICDGSIRHQPVSASKMDSGDQRYDQSFEQMIWPQTKAESLALRGQRRMSRVEEKERGLPLSVCLWHRDRHRTLACDFLSRSLDLPLPY